MQIAEPDLPVSPGDLSIYDAGDTISLTLAVSHSGITGYRVNLTVFYPTEYFFLDANNTDSVQLHINGILQPNSTTADTESGKVTARTDMLVPEEDLVATLTLTARSNVENANSYTVPYTLDWHNLPYGMDGGRFYDTSGEEFLLIKTSQLSMDYTTSDENTPSGIVQIQEQISVNVSVILPEVPYSKNINSY